MIQKVEALEAMGLTRWVMLENINLNHLRAALSVYELFGIFYLINKTKEFTEVQYLFLENFKVQLS